MKKNLSLHEQVKAAQREVEKWPDLVKSATDIHYSEFFRESFETSSSTRNCEGLPEKEIPHKIT